MQAVAMPQVQAALNLLELYEFYIISSNSNGYKVVTFYSTPFVEFAARKDTTSSEVKDYFVLRRQACQLQYITIEV